MFEQLKLDHEIALKKYIFEVILYNSLIHSSRVVLEEERKKICLIHYSF